MGRTASSVPWLRKRRGLPSKRTGATKPGEKARQWLNRSPFITASDSA